MKLGRVQFGDESRWVVLGAAEHRLVPARTPAALLDWIERRGATAGSLPPDTPLSTAPPLPPGKVIGVGLNYRDHAAEVGAVLPDHPLLFAKPSSSVVGPGAVISFDARITSAPDWEVELAVVVGARMHRVATKDALDHVLGYTAANDVTARDIQQDDGQWFRAKSLHTFAPIGPCIVTRDTIDDPQQLALKARVNGDIVQSSTTAQMHFSVAELLSFCSHHFVLEPLDILLTGTPPGVGASMSPARHLRDGDIVEVEVESVGTLRNTVVECGGA